MSTPHEVARDLRERMESAKRAAENPDAGSVYAFEYLLSACEAACARLDLQAGSGEPLSDHARSKTGVSTPGLSAPAAGEETVCAECRAYGHTTVCLRCAESTADSLCGPPVDSPVSRAYPKPGDAGPERLARRFRW